MTHSPDSLRAPTVDARGRRRWLYPDRRHGRLSRLRGRLALVLMAIYIITPFLKIGGLPVLRFDVIDGIIYVLGQSFRFADGAYFVFVFIGLALALGLVTSIWGRIWCGYACPQTVFVEWIIRPIEEWIEGPALKRKRNDAGPWTLSLFGKKLAKWAIFVVVIWSITNAFLAYFIEPSLLAHWISTTPTEHPWAFGFMILTFAVLYFDLVWFREQFCSFLCPYARFQSVMIGASTPTVAYDVKRGEPRGRIKGLSGDCIDCGLCVRVCPTGIDIRHGLQLECIQCSRCSDACDTIMTNIGRPEGLIRTVSETELQGQKTSRFRLRPAMYLLLLLINSAVIIYALSTRAELKVTILRQASTTFTNLGEDKRANYFTVRVVNQGRQVQPFQLTAPQGVSLICSICNRTIAANEELKGNLVVIFPREFAGESIELQTPQGEKPLLLPLLKPGSSAL